MYVNISMHIHIYIVYTYACTHSQAIMIWLVVGCIYVYTYIYTYNWTMVIGLVVGCTQNSTIVFPPFFILFCLMAHHRVSLPQFLVSPLQSSCIALHCCAVCAVRCSALSYVAMSLC